MAFLPQHIGKNWPEKNPHPWAKQPWQIIATANRNEYQQSTTQSKVQFEQPEFTGQMKKPLTKRKKKRKLSPQCTSPSSTKETIPCTRGGPNPEFLRKYNLGTKSHPVDWMNSLLLLTPRDNLESIEAVDVMCDKKNKFSVSNWTSYTNVKAKLMNAGEWGHVLAGQWVDFTNKYTSCLLAYLLWMVSTHHHKFQGSFGVNSKTKPKAMILFTAAVEAILPGDSKCSITSLLFRTHLQYHHCKSNDQTTKQMNSLTGCTISGRRRGFWGQQYQPISRLAWCKGNCNTRQDAVNTN